MPSLWHESMLPRSGSYHAQFPEPPLDNSVGHHDRSIVPLGSSRHSTPKGSSHSAPFWRPCNTYRNWLLSPSFTTVLLTHGLGSCGSTSCPQLYAVGSSKGKVILVVPPLQSRAVTANAVQHRERPYFAASSFEDPLASHPPHPSPRSRSTRNRASGHTELLRAFI